MIRALFLLCLAIMASVLATLYFGNEVLIALGLILTQTKIFAQKLMVLKPAILIAWFKANTMLFFRKDLPYKWVSTVLVPMVLGKALFRRIGIIISSLTAPIIAQRARLMDWYSQRRKPEKVLLTIAFIASTLALSVTTVGLWLILFSISLPLWVVSTFVALVRLLSKTIQKSLFKALAFFQLKWLWRLLQKILPAGWIARKRRFEFRIARAVIRRRRLTVRQLAERKDGLPFQIGVLIEFIFLPPHKD